MTTRQSLEDLASLLGCKAVGSMLDGGRDKLLRDLVDSALTRCRELITTIDDTAKLEPVGGTIATSCLISPARSGA